MDITNLFARGGSMKMELKGQSNNGDEPKNPREGSLEG